MATATAVGLIRWRVFFVCPVRWPDWVQEEAAFRPILFRFSSEYCFGNVASNACAKLAVSTRSPSDASNTGKVVARKSGSRAQATCTASNDTLAALMTWSVRRSQKMGVSSSSAYSSRKWRSDFCRVLSVVLPRTFC